MNESISAFLRRQLTEYTFTPVTYRKGTVARSADGVVTVENLPGRRYGELLEFGGSAVRIRHNHDRRLEDIINRHCFTQLDAWFASSRK